MDENRAQRKTIVGLALLALTGWGAFWVKAKTPPTVKERIVYQDRVVVKDRILTKDIVRTVTKPDGTKIVTATKVDAQTHTSEVEKIRSIESHSVAASEGTKYSLGLSAVFDYRNPLKREYQAEIGRRLWQSPVWVTVSFNTKREALIGLRLEF